MNQNVPSGCGDLTKSTKSERIFGSSEISSSLSPTCLWHQEQFGNRQPFVRAVLQQIQGRDGSARFCAELAVHSARYRAFIGIEPQVSPQRFVQDDSTSSLLGYQASDLTTPKYIRVKDMLPMAVVSFDNFLERGF